MTASGDDQRTRERWRLVPTPVLTRVLAVIGAVALTTVVLSGCGGLTGSSGSAGPTHRAAATVPVGKRPYQVAVDPGSHTVYVANYADNTMSVIDTSTHKVTATVPVGQHPGGLAVDPGTHTVYVPNAADNTVSVIESR